MIQYKIDSKDFGGSGCDMIFKTREDAEQHMTFYTEREREGLEVIEVEVKFAVYVEDKNGRNYIMNVRRFADVDKVGDCLIDEQAEAERQKEEAEDYIDEHGLALYVGIEQIELV